MFDSLSTVMVVVSDMARSVAYYRDVLGLQPGYQSPEWSAFNIGGVTLGLHAAGPHLPVNTQCGVKIGFRTDDIDATVAELERRGAPIVRRSEEEFGVLVTIADPDGYQIDICQYAARG
jgi:predicted enzyme related to lactoylglutathione lyase